MGNDRMRAYSSEGLTLTELLIAAVMAVLMMLGVAAADFAMRRMDLSVSGDAQLYLRTLAIAESIRHSARSAVGDEDDPGIVYKDNSMCFRSDTSHSPGDYSDDSWRCYTKIKTEMYACDMPVSDASAPKDCVVASSRWIGAVVDDVYTCKDLCFYPRLTKDEALGKYFFDFQLISRMHPASGSTVVTIGGVTKFNSKDANNPQVVFYFRVSPESNSF